MIWSITQREGLLFTFNYFLLHPICIRYICSRLRNANVFSIVSFYRRRKTFLYLFDKNFNSSFRNYNKKINMVIYQDINFYIYASVLKVAIFPLLRSSLSLSGILSCIWSDSCLDVSKEQWMKRFKENNRFLAMSWNVLSNNR